MALKRMDNYLAGLPQGLESFADHVQKASVYRELTSGVELVAHAAALPAPLQKLVLQPLPMSSWVPEVHACALFLAMTDLHFSDAGLMQHMYKTNRALVSGPAYGFLFRLLGPHTVLKGARTRWGQLHRGMTLDLLPGDDGARASVEVRFPPGMVPRLLQRTYAEAFRAALDVSGAQDVAVDLLEERPGCASYAARWK